MAKPFLQRFTKSAPAPTEPAAGGPVSASAQEPGSALAQLATLLSSLEPDQIGPAGDAATDADPDEPDSLIVPGGGPAIDEPAAAYDGKLKPDFVLADDVGWGAG